MAENSAGFMGPDWVSQYQSMASGPRNDDRQTKSSLPDYLDDPSEDQPALTPWKHVMQANTSTESVTSSEEFEREQDRLARQEWDEGVKQLQMAFQLVLIPFFGRWLGRRWSYWREFPRTNPSICSLYAIESL